MEIINYDKNARTHSDLQIDQIVNSIRNFGFNDPIEIGIDSVIISGHARLTAALRLGLTTVPVVVHRHLEGSKRDAYVLAANGIAPYSRTL
jgi:ParB-like chromosome segregation protein Spo0J